MSLAILIISACGLVSLATVSWAMTARDIGSIRITRTKKWIPTPCKPNAGFKPIEKVAK